jgi:hypothetical protein
MASDRRVYDRHRTRPAGPHREPRRRAGAAANDGRRLRLARAAGRLRRPQPRRRAPPCRRVGPRQRRAPVELRAHARERREVGQCGGHARRHELGAPRRGLSVCAGQRSAIPAPHAGLGPAAAGVARRLVAGRAARGSRRMDGGARCALPRRGLHRRGQRTAPRGSRLRGGARRRRRHGLRLGAHGFRDGAGPFPERGAASERLSGRGDAAVHAASSLAAATAACPNTCPPPGSATSMA